MKKAKVKSGMNPSESQPKPNPDPVIAEVWRIRDEYAAEHHHNIKEMLADLERRQRRSRRPVARRRKPKEQAKVKA